MNRRTFLAVIPLFAATWARPGPALAAVLRRLREILEQDRGRDTLWRRKHAIIAFGPRAGDREAFERALRNGAFPDDVEAEAHYGQYALALTLFPQGTRFAGATAAQLVVAEAAKAKYEEAVSELRSLDASALPAERDDVRRLRNRLARIDLSWIIEALARTGQQVPETFLAAQRHLLETHRRAPQRNLVTEFGVHSLTALWRAGVRDDVLLRELLGRDWEQPRFPEHETALAGHLLEVLYDRGGALARELPADLRAAAERMVAATAARITSGQTEIRFGGAAHLLHGFSLR